jgi:predicted O-methyltransferase YrrM
VLEPIELYSDVMTVIDAFPEAADFDKVTQFRGGSRQAQRLVWIAELAAEGWPGDLVEIGAHRGATTLLLAEVARRYGRRLLVIDPWSTSPKGRTGREQDYQEFLQYTADYADIIDVLRVSSQSAEAKAALAERQLCFAFVDGLHRYEACLSDIMACAHVGGVIAVDDILWNKDLYRAFVEAEHELYRLGVTRSVSPMREGYLLRVCENEPLRLSVVDVITRIEQSLRQREPLSVVRVGDGEAMMLAWPYFTTNRVPLFQSLQNTFGHTNFSSGDLDRMADNLRLAIMSSDIVGVPDAAHRQKDVNWANVEVYLKAYDLIGGDMGLTDSNLHILMYKTGALDRLIGMSENITIVGCRDVTDVIKRMAPGATVNWLPLPEEGRTSGMPNNHWPDVFQKTVTSLHNINAGELCLVGGGSLGKFYCAVARTNGGIGLDVGSIMDVWAGVHSRSYQRDLL